MKTTSVSRNYGDSTNPNPQDFYLLPKPNARQLNPEKFFAHEYQQINQRRELNGFREDSSNVPPRKIISLALSGGGIRSAAFQLGLLSGLAQGQLGHGTVLGRIDYISSVSGGGWANGAYWAWQKSDEAFFDCLNEAALKGTNAVSENCNNAANMLRIQQALKRVPIWGQRKEKWEEDIKDIYLFDLPNHNVDFTKINDRSIYPRGFSQKPYPIFNLTHSSFVQQAADIKNLPFEITPDYLGTIIDCKSEGLAEKPCGFFKNNRYARIGFFARPSAEGFQWENRKWGRWWKLWSSDEDEPGALLSKAMAPSSGVIGTPILLQYNFHLRYRGQKILEIREHYNLTDGGKSDNLGLIPLIERGSDLIVISQIGKAKKNKPFGDFDLASRQVEKLFGCEVPVPQEAPKQDFVIPSTYQCPNGKGGFRTGTLFYVMPWYKNVEKNFISYLERDRETDKIAEYLKAEKNDTTIAPEDRFPQTPTFKETYDERLIRAYYLLGQYIAREHLNPQIADWYGM